MGTKITFEEIFKAKNPHYEFLLSRMRCAMEVDEVTFDDITTVNLRKFKDYMDGEVSANSLKTYTAVIKAVLNECHNDGLIDNVKCLSALNVKATPQQNIALTESDIRKIEDYYDRLFMLPNHQVEKDVLTLFLIELFCGARGVDVEQMTNENIREGQLSYVSQKTKVLAVMPAHKKLQLLLSRKPKKQYSRMTKNNIVKRVCKKCGFTEPVTLFYHGKMVTKPRYELTAFHTARRSFASVLAAKGAPLAEISQFMSHSSQTMTQRYIKVDVNNVSAASLSFFN